MYLGIRSKHFFQSKETPAMGVLVAAAFSSRKATPTQRSAAEDPALARQAGWTQVDIQSKRSYRRKEAQNR